MDLLCTPAGAQSPLGQTPFFKTHRWDGGSFKGYATRNDRLKWVPSALRVGDARPDVPFTIHRQPDEFDDDHGFFQAWFFFGLLAEIFCLNELEDGSRLVPADEAAEQLDRLYRDFVIDEDGKQYLSGSELMKTAVGQIIGERWASATGGLETRMLYLAECAKFTQAMVLAYRPQRLDPVVHYSICALGELCTVTITAVRDSAESAIALPWGMEYLVPGGSVEAQMLRNGWCRSDLSRIRRVYPRLNTQHYLSCMKKNDALQDHTACSQQRCVAAQIVAGEYKLSHASDGCVCETISIDIDEVTRILQTTQSFPVLVVDEADGNLGSLTIRVEEYSADKPYVALSHVWAHGLGNPFDNALHRCQMARLGRLISQLSKSSGNGTQELRLWIDTLCCPVELNAKIISLQRMATVYRQARHVLVLDQSMTSCQSDTADPALLCLSILACSTWMRRLWTLQEAMLPESVYFQFADEARTLEAMASELFQKSVDDARYMAIYVDIQADALRLNILLPGQEDYAKALQDLKLGDTVVRRLWLLQGSLAFRSVSVPDDEPLCIETLLSLEPRKVAEIQDGHKRMAHIWRCLAKERAIPPKIIFYVDEPLPLPGFGWAPRSLLSVGPDSHLADYELAARFDSLLPFTKGRSPDNPAYQPAVLTESGLRVVFPGFRVSHQPWRTGAALTGWDDLVPGVEVGLTCRHAATGAWYRLSDSYRALVVGKWSDARREAYDQAHPWPLLRDIQKGEVALIKDTSSESNDMAVHLMVRVRVQETAGEQQELQAEVLRPVMMSRFDAANSAFLDILSEISRDTLETLEARHGGGSQASTSKESIIEVLQHVTIKAVEEKPLFEPLFRSIIGFFHKERAWLALAMWLPFNLVLEDLPVDQTWVVDRRDIHSKQAN